MERLQRKMLRYHSFLFVTEGKDMGLSPELLDPVHPVLFLLYRS